LSFFLAGFFSSLFEEDTFVVGCAKVSGEAPDSHRAECFGIFGGILLLLRYVEKWEMNASSINLCVGCGNHSALGYSFLHNK
jgi:hypothetical protein